jgi:hypothetical protein
MANFKSSFTEIADETKSLAKKYRLAALADVALFILITHNTGQFAIVRIKLIIPGKVYHLHQEELVSKVEFILC